MNACNLHLYLVLDAAACGERLLAVAEAALQGGVSVLQLRGHKTAWSKRVWYDTALAVKARCAAHQVPFIINDQVDIALAVGADGVHIGQSDLPAAVVRRLIGNERILGLSTHSVAQVQAVDSGIVDYIGMGPVFPTRSKADADPAIGLDGLAAMPAQRPFADGAHWRPLLDTSRATIEAFVAAERVPFLDDPSNVDTRFARNRLRHAGLPPLVEMAAAVARSAGWLAEAQAVQQALLDGILGEAQTVLPWDALAAAHGATVAKALLRRWLQRAGQPAPPGNRLLSFIDALGGQNGHAELCYGETVVVQHRGCLHLFRASTPQSPPSFAAQTVWPGVGALHLRTGQDLLAGRVCRWALFPCAARWQAPGQRYPQALKNFLQNQGGPPYLRRRLPLLLVDGEAAWLGGFGAAAGWDGLAFDWHQQAHSVSISHHFSSVSDA